MGDRRGKVIHCPHQKRVRSSQVCITALIGSHLDLLAYQFGWSIRTGSMAPEEGWPEASDYTERVTFDPIITDEPQRTKDPQRWLKPWKLVQLKLPTISPHILQEKPHRCFEPTLYRHAVRARKRVFNVDRASGQLAQTPHPRDLGSALTHPHITTDLSPERTDHRRQRYKN